MTRIYSFFIVEKQQSFMCLPETHHCTLAFRTRVSLRSSDSSVKKPSIGKPDKKNEMKGELERQFERQNHVRAENHRKNLLLLGNGPIDLASWCLLV